MNDGKIDNLKTATRQDLAEFRLELLRFENRFTLRVGVMLVAFVAILTAIKFFG